MELVKTHCPLLAVKSEEFANRCDEVISQHAVIKRIHDELLLKNEAAFWRKDQEIQKVEADELWNALDRVNTALSPKDPVLPGPWGLHCILNGSEIGRVREAIIGERKRRRIKSKSRKRRLSVLFADQPEEQKEAENEPEKRLRLNEENENASNVLSAEEVAKNAKNQVCTVLIRTAFARFIILPRARNSTTFPVDDHSLFGDHEHSRLGRDASTSDRSRSNHRYQ